jgi:putative holliday junction resolvase
MEPGRILAFDYGTKRTGVAVSDESRTFSFPLETVATQKLSEWISKYLTSEQVCTFVVGEPLHSDNTPASIEPHIRGFIKKLSAQWPHIQVVRMDERYTSKMAFDAILAGGVPKMKRRDKSLIDKISASIILQSYIDSLQIKK